MKESIHLLERNRDIILSDRVMERLTLKEFGERFPLIYDIDIPDPIFGSITDMYHCGDSDTWFRCGEFWKPLDSDYVYPTKVGNKYEFSIGGNPLKIHHRSIKKNIGTIHGYDIIVSCETRIFDTDNNLLFYHISGFFDIQSTSLIIYPIMGYMLELAIQQRRASLIEELA